MEAVPAPCSDCPSALLPRRLKPSLSRLVPYVSTPSVCVCVCGTVCISVLVAFTVCMYELVSKKKTRQYQIRANRESVGKRELLFHPHV